MACNAASARYLVGLARGTWRRAGCTVVCRRVYVAIRALKQAGRIEKYLVVAARVTLRALGIDFTVTVLTGVLTEEVNRETST